jgi:hypothetical protein
MSFAAPAGNAMICRECGGFCVRRASITVVEGKLFHKAEEDAPKGGFCPICNEIREAEDMKELTPGELRDVLKAHVRSKE